MTKLQNIQQGKRTAEELITAFKLLVGQAELAAETDSDNQHLIKLFEPALNPKISDRIQEG